MDVVVDNPLDNENALSFVRSFLFFWFYNLLLIR